MKIVPIQQKKNKLFPLIPLSLLCRAAVLDNALLFYQVGTCREHFAVTKLTAMKTCILRIWYMLVPVIRLNTAEDFQWTKNNPGSFSYGTFPASTFELQLIVGFIMLQIYLAVCTRKLPKGLPRPSREMAETRIRALAECILNIISCT